MLVDSRTRREMLATYKSNAMFFHSDHEGEARAYVYKRLDDLLYAFMTKGDKIRNLRVQYNRHLRSRRDRDEQLNEQMKKLDTVQLASIYSVLACFGVKTTLTFEVPSIHHESFLESLEHLRKVTALTRPWCHWWRVRGWCQKPELERISHDPKLRPPSNAIK
jgi:hypothetical protein